MRKDNITFYHIVLPNIGGLPLPFEDDFFDI
jgi:hypothetical protein